MNILLISDNPNNLKKWGSTESGNISLQLEIVQGEEIKRKEIGVLEGRRPIIFSLELANQMLNKDSLLGVVIFLIIGIVPQIYTSFTRKTIQLNDRKISVTKKSYKEFLKTTFKLETIPKKFDLTQSLEDLKNNPENLQDITGKKIKINDNVFHNRQHNINKNLTIELLPFIKSQNIEAIKNLIREGADPDIKIKVTEKTQDYTATICDVSLLSLYKEDKSFVTWLKAYGASDETNDRKTYQISCDHFTSLIKEKKPLDETFELIQSP